jgi:hypothetical protein
MTMWHSNTELSNLEIDIDELVAWTANEYLDGYCQGFFSEEQLEAGEHYDMARTMLNEKWAENIVETFLKK